MADVPNTKAVRRALRGSTEDAMRLAAEDLLGKAVAAAPAREGTLGASHGGFRTPPTGGADLG